MPQLVSFAERQDQCDFRKAEQISGCGISWVRMLLTFTCSNIFDKLLVPVLARTVLKMRMRRLNPHSGLEKIAII